MKKIIPVIMMMAFLSGCSKMEEKKTTQTPEKSSQQPPAENNSLSSGKENSTSGSSENKSGKQTDDKAAELVKVADESIAAFDKDKSDKNKTSAISNCLAAGNYLMFDANLPAKEKYRPALKYYRKVLQLDPKNDEAEKNKKQIEDIYTQMGMPIPQ